MCLNPPTSPISSPSSLPPEVLDTDSNPGTPSNSSTTPPPVSSVESSPQPSQVLENPPQENIPQVSDALLSAVNSLGPVFRVIPLHQASSSESTNTFSAVPSSESSPYSNTAPIGIYRGAGGYGNEPKNRSSTLSVAQASNVSYADGTIQQVVVPLHSGALESNSSVPAPQVTVNRSSRSDRSAPRASTSSERASSSTSEAETPDTSRGILRTLVIRLPRDTTSGVPLVESFTTAPGEAEDPIILQPGTSDESDTRWDIIKLPNVTGLGPKILEVKVPKRYRLTQAMLVQTKRRSHRLNSDSEPADKRRKMN